MGKSSALMVDALSICDKFVSGMVKSLKDRFGGNSDTLVLTALSNFFNPRLGPVEKKGDVETISDYLLSVGMEGLRDELLNFARFAHASQSAGNKSAAFKVWAGLKTRRILPDVENKIFSEDVSATVGSQNKTDVDILLEDMNNKHNLATNDNSSPSDMYIHFWVVVLSGCKDISQNFYIESSTGERKETNDVDYGQIRSVFNQKNYWINFSASDKDSESKCSKIEELLLLSWVDNLCVDKECINFHTDYVARFPGGRKIEFYKNAKLELFSNKLLENGLTFRITEYDDNCCKFLDADKNKIEKLVTELAHSTFHDTLHIVSLRRILWLPQI
ncbi:Dynein regulatory complex subunit 7 [Nymphon striatum]|nr:Dynein regulatory complex subunit 7 [Nymphon striatum]